MRQILRIFLALLAASLLSAAVHAQAANQRVYAYRDGDLWKLDLGNNTATQLTEWGYNGGPILSPDGRTIAYLSASANFVAQFNAGSATQTGGTPPVNIWLMDIATESFLLIADQTGGSAAGVLRSLPSWSSDGRRLAWLQIDPNAQPTDAASLRVYDLDSGITTTLVGRVDLGVQDSNIRMPSLRWGDAGIARLLFTIPNAGQTALLHIEIYNADNGALTRYDLGLNANRDNNVRDFEWVSHHGRSQLALQIQDYWEVLDPLSGIRTRLTDPPRLRNRHLSGGLVLIPASLANAIGGWDIHWYAVTGGNVYNTGYKSARVNRNYRPAMAHDGTQMAWHNGDRISTWTIGINEQNRPQASDANARHSFPIPEPVNVVWAPTEWVTTGETLSAAAAPVAQPAASGCELPTLLSVGQQAIVSPGLANRVRSAATISADAIGRMEPGTVVNVTAGPVCADGYHWFAVSGADIAGWSAEGREGEYWLMLHLNCADSPPTRLTTGMSAVVSDDYSVRIRDGVGSVNTNVITIVESGTQFTIIGQQQCDAAGIRWYPIQLNDIYGWIAAGQGDDYWIEATSSVIAG